MNNKTGDNRIIGLDVFRGIAVMAVLFHHTAILEFKNNVIDFIGFVAGSTSVEFFFVLTGFLIGTTILKIHNKETITTIKSIKEFWLRRWFRTLPSYYLVITIYLLLRIIEGWPPKFTVWQWMSQILFLQNATTQERGDFYPIAWSLCIQEWFYLLFPLTLYFLQFVFKRKRQSFVATAVVFLLIPIMLRIYLAINTNIEFYAGFRQMVFLRLDAASVGALCAFAKFYYGRYWNGNEKKFFVAGILIIAGLYVCFYYTFFITYINWKETADAGFFMKVLFFPIFSIAISLMLPHIFSLKVNPANRIVIFVLFIASISYPMYLVHPIVINIVYNLRKILLITDYSRLMAVWIGSIVGGYLLYNLVEKKVAIMRDKYTARRQQVHPFSN